MHSAISSFTPKKYPTPVSFNCTIDNHFLEAEIIEELENPIDYTFKIRFSDGVVVEATSTQMGKWWVNNFKYLPYVKAIENELHDFIQVKNNEWDKFEVKHERTNLLIWIGKSINEIQGSQYSVYYNGSYQFDLRKVKNKWEANCVRVRNPFVNERLASLITLRIDTMELNDRLLSTALTEN